MANVTLTIADGIGRIVLDRPDKMNAITPAMTEELQRVCKEIDDNGAVTGFGGHIRDGRIEESE